MSTCGPGELGWCPRSCEVRPESIATFGKAACPEAQQIAAVNELIPKVVPLVPEGGLFVMLDVRGLRMPSDEVRRFRLKDR